MKEKLHGMQQGSRVFHWSGPQAVATLRRYLRLLKIPHASEFTLKAFRAAQGIGLQMILAAGDWKSQVLLNYVNEERAEATLDHSYGLHALMMVVSCKVLRQRVMMNLSGTRQAIRGIVGAASLGSWHNGAGI